ncbi:MAG: undecaprenyldiphospho-muramoylpentapeptide beta-N-acetylglucosaminyltransferase [Ruminococcaceae bacterium]|nr:undecaprenyldiphospho-muramoylpentapeptide beta-N-acetylglucosaminyltransferase [Oscillospiraceae bacterium]
MNVLMTGGGTGGHVNPAISMADIIKRNQKDANIAFVGTSRGIENKLVPKAGYELYHVEVRGISRSLSPKNIKALWLAFTSVIKAKKLVKSFKPDIVIGTGGYVSWPIIKAAASLGVPTVLHESNAVPGFAVKMLEGSVDKLLINFEETKKFLKHPERAVRVGNPIKSDFSILTKTEAREKLGIFDRYKYVLLSYGGSMGAERVNEEILKVMDSFTRKHPEILHIHATGSIEYEIASAEFKRLGLDKCDNIELYEYIFDMPLKMAAADLVICRAGAMTLTELAEMRKPSVLIPSPNVTNNHQYKNAKVLKDGGAAELIEEKDLSGDALEKLIAEMIFNDDLLNEKSENLSAFAVKGTDKLIYNELMELVK